MIQFLLLLIVVFSSLYGGSVGNPALPCLLNKGFVLNDLSWTHPEMGFLGDFVITKKMRGSKFSRGLDVKNGYINGTLEMGSVSWSIRERFLIQTFLGSGQLYWKWQQKDYNIEGTSHGGLCWSGDAKLIIFHAKDTVCAIDAQAGGWDFMSGASEKNFEPSCDSVHSHFRYWQIGCGLSQQISYFTPYIGCAIQKSRFKVWDLPTGTVLIKPRHVLGPYLGCSISSGDCFLLNLEWRGFFEDGISFSGQIRF